MKKAKGFFSLFFVITVLLCSVPIISRAAEDTSALDGYYEIAKFDVSLREESYDFCFL